MSRSFRRVLAALFALGLLLAACGDDDASPVDSGADPGATCPVGEPECNDTPDGAADPFATCPVGEPECNDTPDGGAPPPAGICAEDTEGCDDTPAADDGGGDESVEEPTEG